MKRKVLILMVIFLIASSIIGCASKVAEPTQTIDEQQSAQSATDPQAAQAASDQQPVIKETLTIATHGEPQTLDPYAHSNELGFYVTHQIYENLIKVDEEGNYIPWLAKTWTQEDELTFVFELRDDVYFHDGSKFTAEDVAFSLALASTSSFTTNLFGPIDPEGFVILDDYKIEVHLKAPSAPLLAALATTQRGMVSKNYYETASQEDIARKPMGTGPMVFQDWVVGDRIVLKANDNYWGSPLAYKSFVSRFIPEASSRAIELETGGVDIAMNLAPADWERIDNNPDTVLISGNTQGTVFLTFNNSIEPFNDINVRRGLAHALNYDALVQVAWSGQATVADTFYAPAIFGHKKLGPFEYNIEKSKEYMALAGYQDGFTFTFNTYESSRNQKFAETVQAMWAEAGYTCNIEMTDVAQFTTMNNDGKLNVSLLTTTAVIPDPAAALLIFPTSRTISVRHMDKHVDELLDKGLTTYDQAEREKIYGELQEYLWEKLYVVPVAFPMEAYASTKNIINLPFYPSTFPDFTLINFLEP